MVLAIASGLLVAAGGGCLVAYLGDWCENGSRHLRRYARWLLAAGAVCTVACVATPTTDEALLIYGMGTVADFMKDDSRAQQLPPEAVDALRLWLHGQQEKNNR